MTRSASVTNLAERRAATDATSVAPVPTVSGGPLVSVVINNYNYEQYLVAAVESALAQHYGNLEVVVVDDGSTDRSLAALAASCRDPRLTVIEQENAGQAAAMNTGFAASKGDVVVFLDADDLLYPTAVPMLVGSLEPGVAKLQYRLDVVDGDGAGLGRSDPPASQRMPSGDLTDRLLERGRYITPVTSGNAFTRAALEAIMPIPVGPFRLCADGYLVYSTPFEGRVLSIDRALGAYRLHGSNLWTGRAVSGPKLEQMLRHDEDKYRAIATAAQRHGRAVASFDGRDHWHLRTELALARTSPEHALRRSTRVAMGVRAARLVMTDELVAPKSRVKLAVWALAVAVAPADLAGRMVGQLYGAR